MQMFKSLTAFLDYLKVIPLTIPDGVRLYSCYARSAFYRVTMPQAFLTIGQFLNGDELLGVKVGEDTFFVRPRTEDIGYLLPAHKPVRVGDDWFKPRAGFAFIDVGASIGSFAIRAARAGMNVLAIEPNPDTYKVLVRNISANSLSNVSAVNLALGSERAIMDLLIPRFGTGLATLAQQDRCFGKQTLFDKHTRVPVVPLDSLTETIDTVEVLMIDVEGFELEVLRGASKTLSKTRKLILELWHGETESLVLKLLGHEGFRLVQRRVDGPKNDYVLFHGPSEGT